MEHNNVGEKEFNQIIIEGRTDGQNGEIFICWPGWWMVVCGALVQWWRAGPSIVMRDIVVGGRVVFTWWWWWGPAEYWVVLDLPRSASVDHKMYQSYQLVLLLSLTTARATAFSWRDSGYFNQRQQFTPSSTNAPSFQQYYEQDYYYDYGRSDIPEITSRRDWTGWYFFIVFLYHHRPFTDTKIQIRF